MGGIAQGLEAIGFNKVAALDCNPLMCETLERNGTPGVILGDVLVAADRAALHQTPNPMRCLVASGFPCQPLSPLSGQGDMKGQADSRSRPFYALPSNTAHFSWRTSRVPWMPATFRKASKGLLGASIWTLCRPCSIWIARGLAAGPDGGFS